MLAKEWDLFIFSVLKVNVVIMFVKERIRFIFIVLKVNVAI